MKKAIVGVFDSGIGGLSILKELIQEMPNENFFYVADSLHAPYGERSEEFILDRANKIFNFFINHPNFKLKGMVIACNTATALTVDGLRSIYSHIPIVGVEPALKPASRFSQTKKVGVLATYGTIHSPKFKLLKESLEKEIEFICKPCNGLAHAIELGNLKEAEDLCVEYINSIRFFSNDEVDSIVLGCTHYPLIEEIIRNIVGNKINIFETGKPVAKQARRLMKQSNEIERELFFGSTGDTLFLDKSVEKWLKINTKSLKLEF